jgi:predicted alpha-1,2-mannosidase
VRANLLTLSRGLVAAALIGLIAAPAGAAPRPAPVQDPASFVDPFIGAGGYGHTFPGATVPFGMVQLSPDTKTAHFGKDSYAWAAGYQYGDDSILGFSHTHFSGTGHSDLGDVLVMPISGDVRLEPGDPAKPLSGYRSRIDKKTETASPGYYAVTLIDYGVRAELTASERVGVHRYKFTKGGPAHLLLDLRHSIYDYDGKVSWSRLRLSPDGVLTGMRETRGWAPGRQLYFAMRFSRPVTGNAFLNREENVPYKGFRAPGWNRDDVAQREGRALEAVVDFGDLKAGDDLLVKVSISGVSEENALKNLDTEVADWDFDRVRTDARAKWNEALSAVKIDAPGPMKKSLYAALYHSLMGPTLFMDVDGRYRGPDNAVHTADGFRFHSTFSLWDTYRAEHPLLTLIQPEQRNADFVRSLIVSQQESPYGILPVWQFQGQETWTMIGYHAVPVIADAWLKGIRGFDGEQALNAMIASATYKQYGGLDEYMARGFVPIDKEPEGASKTVEYAYDDWTIARMAESLGKKDVAAEFDKRAGYWKNVFDTKTGFVRARLSDGSFREPFDPTAINYGSDYTEGNAWQYSWYVPHDTSGLIGALGGDDRLVAKLDAMFDYDVSKLDYSHAEDISGLIGQYIHGNEPSHQAAYHYVHAGRPWRTQERLKQIVDSQYRPTPGGLNGNDDLGQMSAWLVFTGLGFYPVTPASGEYVIGRPFVDRAVLTLPNGKRFTVVTEGLSDKHPYVGKVTLNGKPLDRAVIRHDQILAGGELRFVMSAEPNKAWGAAADKRPYSMTPYR